MLRTRGFLAGVLRLARRFFRAVHFRVERIRLRAGFEDPADTGLLCAWLLPVSTYAMAARPDAIDIAPDFSKQTFYLAAAGNVRVTLASVLWPFVVFALSPSTLRGLIALRTGRFA
jgi:hypothetical protein